MSCGGAMTLSGNQCSGRPVWGSASALPCLYSYNSYCSNQVAAKALLDHKKQDHRVQDFLQRCLESPFSRKLDLWNFLDIPRSRLVKYPLLLREILKHTPNDHPDRQNLDEATDMIQGIVAEINVQTGESECRYYKERLLYLEESQRDLLIDRSRVLTCHGELKNNRGAPPTLHYKSELRDLSRPLAPPLGARGPVAGGVKAS
ncbi:hypothetical protein JZ751_029845 [Albula glossodonta]|uniref:DH domain-containing protein n=1 Tax=Albula glossodonta TaxID=121402 RepID=A0A8T2NKZ7_9TELE|nr:hypothetical protein JZ751_029845 [Albula glossodonta]